MIRINGVKFNDAEFHNGEVIFEKPVATKTDDVYNIIEMYFESNKDIAALLFARQYLAAEYPEAKCDLVMKYCPYERMDREINNQMFSMRYFAEILAKFDFHTIYILDPHSKVCIEQLELEGLNVEIIDLEQYVKKVIDDFQPDYICYPDKGAYSKYPKVLSNIDIPCFYGQKTRDLKNQGRIVDYELVDAPDLTGKKVLIIDDICCLGGTAYNAAVQMKLAGAKEVAFYISHCENGIFAGKILHPEACVHADAKEIEVGDTTYRPYTNPVEQLPWAGTYTIDKIYTADTMKLAKVHENIIIINP